MLKVGVSGKEDGGKEGRGESKSYFFFVINLIACLLFKTTYIYDK